MAGRLFDSWCRRGDSTEAKSTCKGGSARLLAAGSWCDQEATFSIAWPQFRVGLEHARCASV
jgi:hypothetical protein